MDAINVYAWRYLNDGIFDEGVNYFTSHTGLDETLSLRSSCLGRRTRIFYCSTLTSHPTKLYVTVL